MHSTMLLFLPMIVVIFTVAPVSSDVTCGSANETLGVSCDQEKHCCGNYCCGDGLICCSDGSGCCGEGTICCGDYCCGSDLVCCDGDCSVSCPESTSPAAPRTTPAIPKSTSPARLSTLPSSGSSSSRPGGPPLPSGAPTQEAETVAPPSPDSSKGSLVKMSAGMVLIIGTNILLGCRY